MYSVRAHLQGEYEDMKDCYKTLLTYIKVGIVSFFLPSSPPSSKHHEGMRREEKEGRKGEEGGGRKGRREKKRRWRGGKGREGGRRTPGSKWDSMNLLPRVVSPIGCCYSKLLGEVYQLNPGLHLNFTTSKYNCSSLDLRSLTVSTLLM